MDFATVAEGKKRKPAPPPAKALPFDLEAAKKNFSWVHDALDRLRTEADAVAVTDETSVKGAVAMAGQVKQLTKKIEEQRKTIVEDPGGFVKSVNSFCKDFTSKLEAIEHGLKRKIADYQHRQELARREAERKAQEAAAKLQADLDKEAKERGVAPVEVALPVMPKQDTVVRTDTGMSAHVRKAWKGEIVIPDDIPREYCSPDQRKINDAVKAGLRSIPGVRIFEDISTVLR